MSGEKPRHLYNYEWSLKYGGIFASHGLFGNAPIVISDPVLVKELLPLKALSEKPPQFQKLYYNDGNGKPRPNIFSSFTQDPHWSVHRKGMAKFFTPRNLNVKAQHIIRYTTEAMEQISLTDQFNCDEKMIQITSKLQLFSVWLTIGMSVFPDNFILECACSTCITHVVVVVVVD